MHINKTFNDTSDKTINYATRESKGYELDLVYMFAREYNYKVNLINLEFNESNRMNYLLEGKEILQEGILPSLKI